MSVGKSKRKGYVKSGTYGLKDFEIKTPAFRKLRNDVVLPNDRAKMTRVVKEFLTKEGYPGCLLESIFFKSVPTDIKQTNTEIHAYLATHETRIVKDSEIYSTGEKVIYSSFFPGMERKFAGNDMEDFVDYDDNKGMLFVENNYFQDLAFPVKPIRDVPKLDPNRMLWMARFIYARDYAISFLGRNYVALLIFIAIAVFMGLILL